MRRYDLIKMILDRIFAAIALLLLSPILLLTWLAVRVSMGKPALFTQMRPGYKGKLFKIYKFRSMTNRDGVDLSSSDPDNGRVTQFGRLLRSTSIDELPELWNVLRGEMSFVGPRPLLVDYLPLYSPTQARRHEVKPGITGLAQVSGRNDLAWSQRFALDVYYVDHRSFALDLSIILRSIAVIRRRQGIVAQQVTTMSPFRGGE
jgi:lipopolysaccharide/colanic/teichoic acid biosynthesis glycosyltransferase